MTRIVTIGVVLAKGLLVASAALEAQGPQVSHFFHPATEVPWAEAVVYQAGGSRQKVPFMALIATGPFRAPMGTADLTKDVAVDGPLVFIGNGIVHGNDWNSYTGRRADGSLGTIDVSGKVVLFSHDAPDTVWAQFGRAVPLAERIREAANRGAAAVALFSTSIDHPWFAVRYGSEAEVPDIPAIILSRQSVLDIFAASGVYDDAVLQHWAGSRAPPESRELITSMRVRLDGAFETIETENFVFRYPRDAYGRDEMRRIAELNEESLGFLRQALENGERLMWQRRTTVSFPGFDRKLFYTSHVGRGLASQEGLFNVLAGGIPDYGLVVHENMHVLAGSNWSHNTTSFLNEGIATHMEAQATEGDRNHRRTAAFLAAGNLFPLESMTTFEIGMSGLKTDVAYPASGSFTGFLLATRGLAPFRQVFALEARRPEEREADNSWTRAYGKDLRVLEREWLSWLAAEHGVAGDVVRAHLDKAEEARRVAAVHAAVLDEYAGVYRVGPDLTLGITRDGGRLLVSWGGQATLSLLPRTETEFFFQLVDASVTFVRHDDGTVSHLVLEQNGERSAARREAARPASPNPVS
jgi:hypothetical protein